VSTVTVDWIGLDWIGLLLLVKGYRNVELPEKFGKAPYKKISLGILGIDGK
jgi:hypothetical protein